MATGLQPGDRGLNAVWAYCKTSHSPTGGCYYPADLRTVFNDAGSEISYATWFSNLASAGVNLVRIKMTGRNRSCAGDLCGFEPPPYGTFNIWHSDLDTYLPGDLPGYRADQITYPPPAGFWNASNLKEAIDQALANGIKFVPILFESNEFRGDWVRHAWNSANQYVDGNACAAADQGFMANAVDFYTDATARAQAKVRIECAIDLFGSDDVIAGWALFSEIPWCLQPSFWGEPGWNAATRANIRTKAIPWVQEMAQHIADEDPYGRPVIMSHARDDGSGTWDPDPDNIWNVYNEPFEVPEIDIVEINFYENGNIDNAIIHLQMIQEKHHPKVVWVGQYWPFDGGLADVTEAAPFLDSKEHQWVATCGAQWGLGATRWPGITKVAGSWQTGGYADGNYNAIGGVTATFAQMVDWDDWTWPGQNWDSDVTVVGEDRMISWGDGRHVTLYVDYTATGVKTVTVAGLDAGNYHLYIFDWETGAYDSYQYLTASSSLSFDVDVSGFSRFVFVGYLSYDPPTPPTPPLVPPGTGRLATCLTGAVAYQVHVRDITGARIAVFAGRGRGASGGGLQSLVYRKRIRTPGYGVARIHGDDERIALIELLDAVPTHLDYVIEFWRRDPLAGLDWYRDFSMFHRYDQFTQSEEGREVYVARGRGFNDLLQAEEIRWYAGSPQANKSGVCETIAKEYVDENVGPGATVAAGRDRAGDFQGLTVQADAGGGAIWTGGRANKNLLDVLVELAEYAPGDFMLVPTSDHPDPITMDFRWRAGRWGEDRTWGNAAGNPPVVFTAASGNVESVTMTLSRLEEVNVVDVGGPNAGAARLYTTRTSGAEDDSPWARRAVFRDGRNDGSVTLRQVKADGILDKQRARRIFSFEVRQTLATRYGRDWNVGDLVTLEFRDRMRDQKVVGATINVAEDGMETITTEAQDA